MSRKVAATVPMPPFDLPVRPPCVLRVTTDLTGLNHAVMLLEAHSTSSGQACPEQSRGAGVQLNYHEVLRLRNYLDDWLGHYRYHPRPLSPEAQQLRDRQRAREREHGSSS